MPSHPPSDRIKILLVDDHIVLRMGLVLATSTEPDMEVVGEANNGIEALEVYRAQRPDVVVLDLRMPKQNGIETIRALRQEFADSRVVVFSNYASGDEVYEALMAGAAGFVVKEMALERLLEAIRQVYRGERYVPPEVSSRMTNRVLSQLSSRELDVLRLMAKGLSNKEIAAALNVAEATVKVHAKNMFSKLAVSDRTQAILTAVKRGIIQIE